MTNPISNIATQIADLQKQVNGLAAQRVTYVQAPVISVNTAGSTFGASIPNPADGTATTLTGIVSPAQFLPSIGQTVTIALAGPVPVYQPTQVAPGTISPVHLAPNAPGAPTGLTLSTSTTLGSDGTVHGQISATWTAPGTTVGGSAIVGALTYVARYRATGGSGAYYSTNPATTSALLTGSVAPGTSYDVQVAAVDQTGNVGAYTAVSSITVGTDTTPPVAPTAPAVSNYLGQLKITWDGNLSSGPLPPDFDHVAVHVGTTSSFTPSSATEVGDLAAAGAAYSTAAYGTTMWVKLIAVDRSGNVSTPSSPTSGSTSQVVSADIFAGAVGTSQLASLAVTTAKIANLAVNDAQIGTMAVGKLTAGTMAVDVVMGGRFCTALTGARVEMNSLGFQKYNSSGNLVVSITGTDNYMYGEFQTGSTGRYITIGASGNTGEIDFYSPSGIHSWIKAWTETWSPNYEAINIGLDVGGHPLYNRVNVDNIPQIRLDSNWIMNAFPTNGTFGVYQYTDTTSFSNGLFSRMIVDGTGFHYYRPNTSIAMDIQEGVANNRVRFFPAGTGNGSVELLDNAGVVSQSPRLALIQGGDSIATVLKSYAGHIEVRDGGDTVFAQIQASSFTVGSDEESKTNIKDAALDGVTKVRALRPRTYQRKPGLDATGNPLPMLPPELGLVAQEAPPEILANTITADGELAINLYSYTTLLAVGLQQGLAKLDALTTRVSALDGKVSK